MVSTQQQPLIYFQSLELENVRGFGERQVLKLTDDQGRLCQWTLLLGENGVGKTTLLQCLAWMRPQQGGEPNTVVPALTNEENAVLNSLLRVGSDVTLELKATLSVNQALKGAKRKIRTIETRIHLVGKKGELQDMPPPESSLGKGPKLDLRTLPIFAYGAARRMGLANLDRSELADPLASLFSTTTELYDAEEVLLQLDYLAARRDYQQRLHKVKEVLATILPDITSAKDIQILGPKVPGKPEEPSGVRFVTPYGIVPLASLSLGYQTTIAWATDLAIRLYDRYPNSPDPLAEPAIVLIDEIDLHLHPCWQLRLIEDLTPHFPRVQFIATAHSPLMVQVNMDANLAVLHQKDGQVVIENEPYFVKNWRVDQILTSDLFGIPSARNPHIKRLLEERNTLLDKLKRTSKEEKRLRELEHELDNLPTAEHPKDQEAMDLIRQAAALLKKESHNR